MVCTADLYALLRLTVGEGWLLDSGVPSSEVPAVKSKKKSVRIL